MSAASTRLDFIMTPSLWRLCPSTGLGCDYRRQSSARREGYRRLVRMLFYVPVRDIDCAFKLFRREALADIDIESRGAMINTEIMVKLARAARSVVEVPVTHLPRTEGTASGANVRVVARAFREMMRMHSRLSQYSPAREPVGAPNIRT